VTKKIHSDTRRFGQALAASLVSLCVLSANPLLAQDKPGFVSIDFCADQYLLGLAEADEIQAVSYEATEPQSFYSARAQGLPTVTGAMEQLLLMQPTMVLRTWKGGPRAKDILDSAGIASFQPPYAYSLESNFETFLAVGAEIGKTAEAEALVADQRQRLAKLQAHAKSQLKAVYMTPSGFTAGTGTFVDGIIKLAGFDTVAEEAGIRSWAPLPLEKIVLSPPDFIVAAFFDDKNVHVSHWSSGRHGVNKRLMAELPVIHIPSRYLSCSGAFTVKAAEYIRAEALELGLIKAGKGAE